MKKTLTGKLTYSNVISTLCLFLLLGGGTAFAASKLAKNSVGTKQLKSNSVTAAKLKKNAVTGAKIASAAVTGAKVANGSLTGANINLSTLGAVPSATNAVNATNATNFSRYFTSGLVKASLGQTVPLLSIGSFSIVGHCEDAGGGEPKAISKLTTSQPKASAGDDAKEYNEANFEPGTELEVGYQASSTTPEVSNYGYGGYYSAFWALSGDGKTLLSGEVTNAVNVYGSQCAFWAEATNGG
jgi:hypothetical protein